MTSLPPAKKPQTSERSMLKRYTEREKKWKEVAPQPPPDQSSNSSPRTNGRVAKPKWYEPSGYLLSRALSSSLPARHSSTEVHEHHDKPESTINSRGREKPNHTSSFCNTNIPTPVPPNILPGSFPSQSTQKFVVSAASTAATSSQLPPHPSEGILGRTPPQPGYGILGCKPAVCEANYKVDSEYQNASLEGVHIRRPAMYNIPNSQYYLMLTIHEYQHESLEEINKRSSHNNVVSSSYNGYQHPDVEEANMRPSHNNIPNSPVGYQPQPAYVEEVNMRSSHNNDPNSHAGYSASLEEVYKRLSQLNLSNTHDGMVASNQVKAKSSTSRSLEFLPGRFSSQAPQIESERERANQCENLAVATQQQPSWPKLYTLFPPSPALPPHPPHPHGFEGKVTFGDDPVDPYYPLPAHFINMDDSS